MDNEDSRVTNIIEGGKIWDCCQILCTILKSCFDHKPPQRVRIKHTGSGLNGPGVRASFDQFSDINKAV